MTFAISVFCALTAPLLITTGFVVWEKKWHGHAIALNIFKGLLSGLFYLITLSILYATDSDDAISPPDLREQKRKPWSDDIEASVWGWLLLSGLIGITIGDILWLSALQMIGARRVILVDSLKPFLASFFGYLWMDEDAVTSGWFVVGLIVTMGGIVVAALEVDRAGEREKKERERERLERIEREQREEVDTNKKAKLKSGIEDAVVKGEPNSNNLENGSGSVEVDGIGICLEEHQHQQAPTSTTVLKQSESEIVAEPASPVSPSKRSEAEQKAHDTYVRGYIFAIVNVVFDVYGATLFKIHCKQLNTLEVNGIRFGACGITLGLLATGYRLMFRTGEGMWQDVHTQDKSDDDIHIKKTSTGDDIDKTSNDDDIDKTIQPLWYRAPNLTRSEWIWVSGSVFLVTFTGPALAVYGMFSMPLGLAMTLTSTGPLWTIPVVYFLRKEVVSLIGQAAALLAVGGIVFLCLLAVD